MIKPGRNCVGSWSSESSEVNFMAIRQRALNRSNPYRLIMDTTTVTRNLLASIIWSALPP